MERKEKKSLVNEIFSWSINDIINKDYKDEIRTIPDQFCSVDEYLKTFVPFLLEETRTELFSSMKSLSKAPAFHIRSVERKTTNFSSRRSNCFNISLSSTIYEPKCGHLVALTETARPRRVDDLNPLVLAYVFCVKDELNFSVHSSKFISIDEQIPFRAGVFLMTLTSNTRIWKALRNEDANLSLIKSVLQANTEDTKQVVSSGNLGNDVTDLIRSANLNSAQESAILSCLENRNLRDKTSVKLIWGPPGTGKTKTVATLLFALLNSNCKTVVCAPTNTAVVEVASRLFSLLKEYSSSQHCTQAVGSIVLSGNRERMGIDKRNDDLISVFLDNRISILPKLLSSVYFWESSLKAIIDYLEKSESNYKEYLLSCERRAKQEREKNKNILTSLGEFVKRMFYGFSEELDHKEVEFKKNTFGEFAKTKFNSLSAKLEKEMDHMVDLYKHLPKSLTSSNHDLKKIMTARQALHHARYLLQENYSNYDFNIGSFIFDCLRPLHLLPKCVEIPAGEKDIERFCLQNATIIFCTASGSAEMKVERTGSIEMLVVDEAAQLKECESVAPMQLQGLRHVVLIGDEFQLPAMVQSEVCEKAKFGRSLFERLVLIGYKKLLGIIPDYLSCD